MKKPDIIKQHLRITQQYWILQKNWSNRSDFSKLKYSIPEM